MPVATWLRSIFTTQTSSAYKAAIDGNCAVSERIVDSFAPRQTTIPAMTVTLDAGNLFNGTTLTEVGVQTIGTFVAPVGNPRIDRVVIDAATGGVSVITGTPAASPVAPAITAGKFPVAQILLQTTSTTITNTMITDERCLIVGCATNQSGGTVNATTGTFSGPISVGTGAVSPNIELGRTDGVVSSPVVDFHSGVTVVDFDTRIMSYAAMGSDGTGKMDYTAYGGHAFLGPVSASGLISANGGQIKFPATQIPSADPNTLDDYEEGTFTVSVGGTSVFGTATIGGRAATYTKVGNRVTFDAYIYWTAHTGSGNMSLAGLPFTAANNGANSNLYIGDVGFIPMPAGSYMLAYVYPAGTVAYITYYTTSPNTGTGTAAVNMGSGGGLLRVSGTYAV